jgi:hypothetical protein
LLCGDLTYSCDLLHQGIVPGVGNARQLHETSNLVLELEKHIGTLEILAAHDPTVAPRLAATALGSA